MAPYLFAQIDKKRDALRAAGYDVISLGIGDPDMPTPEHIVDEMARAIRNPANHRYPDYDGSPAYRQACASYMKSRFGVEVNPDTQVLALIGSKEGIAHLHTAFVNPGDYVLAPSIGYPVYSGGATLQSAHTYFMPMKAEKGFLADFDDIPEDVLKRTKIMFIGYPNNPTGACATEEYFDKAIAFCLEHDILLAHDNAYCDICFDGYRAPSILERPHAMDCCIEFFSLSKTYNMTGWRIAFACGNAKAVEALGTVKNNLDSGQFTAIQDAAIAALTGPQDCVHDMCALYERRRDLVVSTLRAIGVECTAPKATIYVWARVPEGETSESFATKLLEKAHVIVTPGNGYGPDGEGFIRISLTIDDKRLEEALDRMKTLVPKAQESLPVQRFHSAQRGIGDGREAMREVHDNVIVVGPATHAEEVKERAVLVGVSRSGDRIQADASLAELARLVETDGAITVAQTSQTLDAPHPRYFVGSGKVAEIVELCQSVDADVVVFDDELTPSQQANLEKAMPREVKVIDRTALILDIFALHATTAEGRLQVRLAQNQYLLPRLRGMWAHLASNRMGGGVGSRFGEGESQLEVDRRIVRKRITSIKRELEHLARVRSLQRKNRRSSGMFTVALAGYTNAGKSSLLNRLTDADVLSYDKLFATLDSTTRKYTLPEGRQITLTDTVGFIQKLPTTLIEAFKSTLDEIRGADLILHVVDASSAVFGEQIEAVAEILEQIGAQSIPAILVFNKCDLLDQPRIHQIELHYPHALCISAETGTGVEDLVNAISRAASSADVPIEVVIPFQRGDLVSLAHRRCAIISETHEPDGTHLTMMAHRSFISAFEPYIVNGDER